MREYLAKKNVQGLEATSTAVGAHAVVARFIARSPYTLQRKKTLPYKQPLQPADKLQLMLA
jgi:hypothetical protein